MNLQTRLKSSINVFIRDRDGNIVVAQKPNLPAVSRIVFAVAGYLLDSDPLKTACQSLSLAFLFTWSYLEVTQGLSYFRRMLGVIGMVMVVTIFFVQPEL